MPHSCEGPGVFRFVHGSNHSPLYCRVDALLQIVACCFYLRNKVLSIAPLSDVKTTPGPLYCRIAFQGATIVLAEMEENADVLAHDDERPNWATVPTSVPTTCRWLSFVPTACSFDFLSEDA